MVFRYLIIFFLILSSRVYTQATIWLEDFSSEATGATIGNNDNTANPAADWTTSCATCNLGSEFRVDGNQFHVENTDELATWTSEVIDITGYTDVGGSVEIDMDDNDFDATDCITISYRLNGGAPIIFPNNGALCGDGADPTFATVTGLTGTSIQIIIQAITTSTNEDLFFDNIRVTGRLPSPPLAFIIGNNQPADKVFNQPNFTTNTATTTQVGGDNCYHTAVDPTTGKVFISDLGNNRVLRYANIDAVNNGTPAEAVLGQTNFTNNGAATAQNRFNNNTGIYVGSTGTLWVTEFANNRVLRFDNASSKATGANADGVLGQVNFTNNGAAVTQNGMQGPLSVFEENDGTLWIADQNNQRILRFDNAAAKANGANADGVLGKGNFTTNGTNLAQDRTGAISGVTVNNSGRLYASDLSNNRVLWWDNAKGKANGANADGVLAQPDFTSGGAGLSRFEFNNPRMVSVTSDNQFLSVSDAVNNRILIYLEPGNEIGEVNADFVFGQPNFTTGIANNGGLSASSIFNPRGVFLYQTSARENYLFVSDRSNHRTKVYVLFDIFYTTDAYTTISGTFAATEVDGDVLTFSIVDSTSIGSIQIDDVNLGTYTYTPVVRPNDYADTVTYEVCDKDGCDTSIVIFNVLSPARIWLKADEGVDGTTNVVAWNNQSVIGDSVYANAGAEPSYLSNRFNFNPAIRFNGTTDFMYKEEGTINIVNPVYSSLFIVASARTQKNQHLFYEETDADRFGAINLWGDGNAYFEAKNVLENGVAWGGALDSVFLWSFVQDSSTESISRNGLELISNTSNTDFGKGDTAFIGYDRTNFYDGDIAEVYQFQYIQGSSFQNGEVNSVESYMAIKYGITLDQTVDNDGDGNIGTDYTLSDTSSIAWNETDNVGYNHDITGIGRDDRFQLNQKQSKSVNYDAIITMGLDSIAIDNLSHGSTFSKDSIAFMWANNDSSLSAWSQQEVRHSYNTVYRLKREWKVEENLGDVGTLALQVNSADLPVAPYAGNKLFLAIDEDLDGDFTTGDIQLVRMTNNAGVWEADVDFSDGQVFTFMFIQFDFMRHGKNFYNQKENVYRWVNRR